MTAKKSTRRAAVSGAMGRAARTTEPSQPPESNGAGVAVAEDDGDQGAVPVDSLLDAVAAPTAADVREAQVDAAEHVDQLRRFDLATVAPHPFNPPERMRVTDALTELGRNIAEVGLHQPLVLSPRRRIDDDDPTAAAQLPEDAEWVLIAGHRRYAAATHVAIEDLPGLVRTGPCDPVTVAGIFRDENFLRETPDPIMEAQMYQRMAAAGLSTTQIGQRCNVTQPQVSKTLRLCALTEHPEVAAEMRAGRLTRADAYEYLALGEDTRAPVFQAWLTDQQSASPQSLRVHAHRASRARNTPQEDAEATETAEGDQHPARGEIDGENATQDATGPSVEAITAVLGAGLTPTQRAELLTDAALYVDDRSDKTPTWRPVVAEALGIDLPTRGSLGTLDLPQAVRRKIAVGRALVLLDAELTRHARAESTPPHVERHRQRLVDLGLR